MKLEINTQEKTIIIKEEINISDLFNTLANTLVDFEEYKIVPESQLYTIYYPDRQTDFPWDNQIVYC